MANTKIDLNENEIIIDNWALNYVPPAGGKYNGNCIITNQRILFGLIMDYSATGILFKGQYFKKGQFISINKSEITSIEMKKGFLGKKMMLTLDNGEVHTFDRGVMNIDAIEKAMQTN
jgi:Bacterial PH domain